MPGQVIRFDARPSVSILANAFKEKGERSKNTRKARQSKKTRKAHQSKKTSETIIPEKKLQNLVQNLVLHQANLLQIWDQKMKSQLEERSEIRSEMDHLKKERESDHAVIVTLNGKVDKLTDSLKVLIGKLQKESIHTDAKFRTLNGLRERERADIGSMIVKSVQVVDHQGTERIDTPHNQQEDESVDDDKSVEEEASDEMRDDIEEEKSKEERELIESLNAQMQRMMKELSSLKNV